MFGCLVAHQLESVTAFDQRLALGGEPFQVDGFYLGAVLFTLAPPLRLLIVVEFALDPVGSAVEEIDGRPEQIVEVGLEAHLDRLVAQVAPELVSLPGIGTENAATLLIVALKTIPRG